MLYWPQTHKSDVLTLIMGSRSADSRALLNAAYRAIPVALAWAMWQFVAHE